jgi:hypothetical protein
MTARVSFSSATSAAGKRPFKEAADLQLAQGNATEAIKLLKAASDVWSKDDKRKDDATRLQPFLAELQTSLDNGTKALEAMLRESLGLPATGDAPSIYQGALNALNTTKAKAFATEIEGAGELTTTAAKDAAASQGALVQPASPSQVREDYLNAVRNLGKASGQETVKDAQEKVKDAKEEYRQVAPDEFTRLEAERARRLENEGINRQTRQSGTEIRTIVGFEQTGAANAPSAQHFFLNLFASHPFTLGRAVGKTSAEPEDALGPHWRIFGDFRLSSAPVQQSSTLSTVVTGFGGQVANLSQNQIVQSGEFLTGLGVRVGSFAKPFFRAAGDKERIAIYGLAEAGGIGNFTTLQPTAYTVPGKAGQSSTGYSTQQLQALCQAVPGMFTPAAGSTTLDCTSATTAYDYLGFQPPERNQFFRQGYAGLRLISHDSCVAHPNGPCAQSAARFDVLFGENQAVTNGTYSHPVWKFEAFYPIQIHSKPDDGNGASAFDGVVYVFASYYMQRGRTSLTGSQLAESQLVLQPSGGEWNAYTSKTYYVPALPSYRDYYRVGLGVDLYRLLANYLTKDKTATENPPSGSATAGATSGTNAATQTKIAPTAAANNPPQGGNTGAAPAVNTRGDKVKKDEKNQ